MSNINITLHPSKIQQLKVIETFKRRIKLLQQIFENLINSICMNESTIINNYLNKMGPDYINHLCNNTSINIDYDEFFSIKEDIDKLKGYITTYQHLATNNVFNLFVVYCYIMLVKRIFNLLKGISLPNMDLSVDLLVKDVRELKFKYTVPDLQVYTVLSNIDRSLDISKLAVQIGDSMSKIQSMDSQINHLQLKSIIKDDTNTMSYIDMLKSKLVTFTDILSNLYTRYTDLKKQLTSLKNTEDSLIQNINELEEAIENDPDSEVISKIKQELDRKIKELTQTVDTNKTLTDNFLDVGNDYIIMDQELKKTEMFVKIEENAKNEMIFFVETLKTAEMNKNRLITEIDNQEINQELNDQLSNETNIAILANDAIRTAIAANDSNRARVFVYHRMINAQLERLEESFKNATKNYKILYKKYFDNKILADDAKKKLKEFLRIEDTDTSDKDIEIIDTIENVIANATGTKEIIFTKAREQENIHKTRTIQTKDILSSDDTNTSILDEKTNERISNSHKRMSKKIKKELSQDEINEDDDSLKSFLEFVHEQRQKEQKEKDDKIEADEIIDQYIKPILKKLDTTYNYDEELLLLNKIFNSCDAYIEIGIQTKKSMSYYNAFDSYKSYVKEEKKKLKEKNSEKRGIQESVSSSSVKFPDSKATHIQRPNMRTPLTSPITPYVSSSIQGTTNDVVEVPSTNANRSETSSKFTVNKYLQYGRGNDSHTDLLQKATESITTLNLPNKLLPLVEILIKTYQYTNLKSIYETILKGLSFIKENDSQRKSMPKEFKQLTIITEGIELVKLMQEYPSNILDKIKLNILEQSLDGQVIKYQKIDHPNNAILDDIIKKAILSTLNPRQKNQIDPLIQTINPFMDKLQPYTTDECIIYNKLNTEKIKDFIRQIVASNNYREIRKICGYIDRVKPRILSQQGGSLESNYTYINIKDILKENPQQEINLRCSFAKDNACKFCNKFTTEKTNFKKLVGKMVKKDDMMEVLELMNASVDLLPVAILDKNEFHKFHIAMQEYKQSKKSQ